MLSSLHRAMTRVLSEQITILIYAVIIGLGGGYGAVAFRWMIVQFTFLFFHQTQVQLASFHGIRSFFVPIIGGLIVGPIIYFFAREASTLMNELNTTYLLIVDEQDVACGIIGSSDIVRSYQY